MRLILGLCSFLLITVFSLSPAYAGSVSGSLVEVLHEKGVIDDDTYTDLKDAEALGGEKAVNEKLIEVLHNKGVIDDDTYKRLSAEAAKPAPVPVVAAAPQASAPGDRPLDKALTGLEEGFARLGGDAVKLKIGTWTQLGYVNDNAGSNAGALPGSSSVTSDSGNQFYIRFARIYFNGQLGEKIGFRVMLDPADTTGKTLRDAFVWSDYIPYTRATVGQFLTPFGSETWHAPFELPQINYSFPAMLMQFTNFRDTGAMVANKYSTKVGSLPLGFQLQNCILQGNGINSPDDNDQKDWLGRMTINPLVPGLNVGGSWYIGKTGADSQFDNQRWGAEFDYNSQLIKGLLVRGEYMRQRKYFTSAYVPTTSDFDASKAYSTTSLSGGDRRYYHSEGWYVTAAYSLSGLSGGLRYLNDVEPTFRYDYLDEDLSRDDDERDRLTFGINYWFNKYMRMLNNYEVIHAGGALKTKSLLKSDQFGHQVFTANLQIWF